MVPDFIKKYGREAEGCYRSGCVKDLVFSGGTYQVQVFDQWAFLQFDDQGRVLDFFCTCEDAVETIGCLHLAVAYLRIMGVSGTPLHVRFEESLWNVLCQCYAHNYGYDAEVLDKKASELYRCYSEGRKVFVVEAYGEEACQHLEEILEQRAKETDKTSIKFSNLSDEEIARWREGRPSSALLYELSFWADLAKWLMVLQDDGEKYEIHFEYSEDHLPQAVAIRFPQIRLTFEITKEMLPALIPAFATVEAPLSAYPGEIEKITYDRDKGILNIISQAGVKDVEDIEGGIEVGKWKFVPGDGFYSMEKRGLLTQSPVTADIMSQTLTNYTRIISRSLVGVQIHESPVELQYTLNFDADWNLHISSYLFEPGDLQQGKSRDFGLWVFLDGDGFYPLEYREFDALEVVVSNDKVVDYIIEHQSWFNSQDGFHLHFVGLGGALTYSLSDDDTLSFERELDTRGEMGHKDFGSWIYLAGHGFYSKEVLQPGLSVQPGMCITKHYIPTFITMNRSELELVRGFFAERCPVVKATIRIDLDAKNHVVITPEYEILPEYQDHGLRFFDEMVFVPGEGFSQLPAAAYLPERFRSEMRISGDGVSTFIAYELDLIKKYASFLHPHLLKPESVRLIIERFSEVSRGRYAVTLAVVSEKGRVAVTSLWQAVEARQFFAFTDAGCLALGEDRYDWLWHLNEEQVDVDNNVTVLSIFELLRLHAFEPLVPDNDEVGAAIQDLVNFTKTEEPNIEGLTSHLRPYQMIGAQWLWFLRQHGLSGLLCDDMGLGKTHEAMALMAAVINTSEERPRFLVVCPTSVLFPWEEKLEQFLPRARLCIFHGAGRRQALQHDYDILLTSYGIWRNEKELLSSILFDVAIFDEVQIAKNRGSLTHRALKDVNAKMRLGLTGTPIENQLWELKALFDIVVPGYMPGDARYRDAFVSPIEKYNDNEARRRLSRFVNPFVLHRKKEDVLDDLPEKTEEIIHCQLMDRQRQLYMETLQRGREGVMRQLYDETQSIPYLHIFALLTHLKQICNHPATYLKDVENYHRYSSGKWELFVELLSEARASGQKVVVFSQYLATLDIMELYLREQGINYATIRGSTRDRAEQLRQFNKEENCEVFLGSLQAVGLGVDLTAASVVIHYDRWWNAAREAQATDRVHRIGQTRGVQVFKLVTLDSFEERIDQIIAQKAQLLEEVIGADDQYVIKKLSRDELIALLQLEDS